MADEVEFRCGDVRTAIRALKERLENPKPVFKELARKITADIKANIKSGGTNWPPYAASTMKRMEHTGTSLVNARGKIRGNRVDRTMSQLARLDKCARKHGWSTEVKDKIRTLSQRLMGYRKAEGVVIRRGERAAAAEQKLSELSNGPLTFKDSKRAACARETIADSKKDRIGRRVSEVHPLLNKIPGTIRSKLIGDGRTLYIYSSAGAVGVRHNSGSGKTPKRQFLPPPDMVGVMAYFKFLMESALGQAWDSPKKGAR